jgi:CRISPR/Cas system-associated exonuclease Cas4 (RecB family)
MASTLYPFYDHASIVAPKSRHPGFLALKEEDPHLDFELYTLEDLEALFAYHYDDRALLEVYGQVGDEELAEKMLLALSRLSLAKSYPSPKLEALKPLQEKLIGEGYLYKLPNPERSFEGRNVVISGYQDSMRISSVLGELHNMAISYDNEERPAKPLRIAYAFEDIYDELKDVFNRIAADLDSGTPIERIFLAGVDDSYENLLFEFSKRYGFAIVPTQRRSLADSAIYHAFKPLYLSRPLPEAFQALEGLYPDSADVAALEAVFSRFPSLPKTAEVLSSFFDKLLSRTAQEAPAYQNVVRVLEGYVAPKDAHVYLLNFAMGVFPPLAAEGDYLTDGEAALLGLPTSGDLSKEWALEVNALLDSSALRYVAYKKKAFGALYFPSGLLEEKGFATVKNPRLGFDYSLDKEALLEASLRDEEVNYLYVDPRLRALEKGNPLPDYRNFDYRYQAFCPLDPKAKRSYSPTQLKKYYGCPFSYYLERILAIEENEPSFSSRIGTLFHAVMEALYERKPFDFETEWASALQEESQTNGPFGPKESALLLRLKDECRNAVDFYQSHDSLLSDPSVKTEEPFTLESEENPLVSFSGQFDKIVSFGKAARYYIIVDYKSGSERFDEGMLPYGLSLQLPYYAYYAEHSPALKNEELIGLFIGPILSTRLVKDEKESLEKFNNDKFKLEGVFANDITKLLALDPSAYKSTFIRSLAYSEKGGFYAYSLPKAKSPEDFRAFSASAKQLTLAADERIRKGDFAIAPAVYKTAFDACAYCSFRDVCYRKDEAIRHLPVGKPTPEKADEDEDETKEGQDDGME